MYHILCFSTCKVRNTVNHSLQGCFQTLYGLLFLIHPNEDIFKACNKCVHLLSCITTEKLWSFITVFFCTTHQRFTATGDATAPTDIMFIKNANPRRHSRHHELFLPSRPYRGEPPTVAGKALLLFCHSLL